MFAILLVIMLSSAAAGCASEHGIGISCDVPSIEQDVALAPKD